MSLTPPHPQYHRANLTFRSSRSASHGRSVTGSAQRVLLVDDDADLCAMLGEYLTGAGLEISTVHDGMQALEAVARMPPDVLVLDVSMPGMDGFEVLRRLHAITSVPVLFLTGRDEDDDRVHGLDLGADDYLTKPFNSRELLARIHAILRRTGSVRSERLLRIGLLCMDCRAQQATVNGVPVPLTHAEFRILEILAEHAGKVVTRSELMRLALGRAYLGLDRSIDTHVSALRRKLGPEFELTTPLQSARGLGYVMRTPSRTTGA